MLMLADEKSVNLFVSVFSKHLGRGINVLVALICDVSLHITDSVKCALFLRLALEKVIWVEKRASSALGLLFL